MTATSAPIDRLLDKLENVKRSGTGYSCRCPSHPDRQNSLSLTEGDDGRVLLHCFKGCSEKQITAALGLTVADLFPERRPAPPSRPTQPPRRYEIRGTNGELQAIHYRRDLPHGGKQMWWALPEQEKPGLQGRPLATLPLYRSETLAKVKPGAIVIVTEGESAADAASHLGYAAVGTVTGASSAPSADVLSSLRGFDVVYWPDHDAAGRDHARRQCATLDGLGIPARILTWPDAREKDDAADFLERGGTAAQLQELINAAPTYQSIVEAEKPCDCPKCQDRILQLERERDEAREHHRRTMEHLRSGPGTPIARIAFVMALYQWEEKVSHGADPNAPVPVGIGAIAESAGISAATCSTHLKHYAEAGVFTLNTRGRRPTGQIDPRTGKERWISDTFLTIPQGDPVQTLAAARTVTFPEAKPWGGKRPKVIEETDPPTCEAHPDDPEDLELDWLLRCKTDGEILMEGKIAASRVPEAARQLIQTCQLERSEYQGEPDPEEIADLYVPTYLMPQLERSDSTCREPHEPHSGPIWLPLPPDDPPLGGPVMGLEDF